MNKRKRMAMFKHRRKHLKMEERRKMARMLEYPAGVPAVLGGVVRATAGPRAVSSGVEEAPARKAGTVEPKAPAKAKAKVAAPKGEGAAPAKKAPVRKAPVKKAAAMVEEKGSAVSKGVAEATVSAEPEANVKTSSRKKV